MDERRETELSRRKVLQHLAVGVVMSPGLLNAILSEDDEAPRRRSRPAPDFACLLDGVAEQPTAGLVADTALLDVADPALVGSWTAPFVGATGVIGIHAILLHTGKVLMFQLNRRAALWDPVSRTSRRVDSPENLFCAGHCVLADGDVLVAGGHIKNHYGIRSTYRFRTEAEQWVKGPDMARARWYPTVTTLADGRVLITGGNVDGKGVYNPDVEIYDGDTIVKVGERTGLRNFAKQFLLPDRRVLVVTNQGVCARFDPATTTWSSLPKAAGGHFKGAGVLASGPASGSSKVVLYAGTRTGGAASTFVETIDVAAASPTWSPLAPLPDPRQHLNSVILPDGRVLVVGGNNAAGNLFSALLYDPVADAWSRMASQVEGRDYHSTALLLPDARVLSAGDNNNVGGRERIEIFSPPYLFRGSRPSITSAPGRAAWGSTIQLGVSGDVAEVVLLRPGSVTHSVDMDQRRIELATTSATGGIAVTLPSSPGVAPPGPYLVFVLDPDGTPSVGSWLFVGE